MIYITNMFLLFVVCLTQSGWLEELQLLGYMDPLPIPARAGLQAIMATIEPIKLHRFIQNYDGQMLDDAKQNPRPLFLETLDIHEFFHIAYLACTEDISSILDIMNTMVGELTSILEHDDIDMDVACEKSHLVAFVVKQQPSPNTS